MSPRSMLMPAEWAPHEGTLLCFPHNGKDWPGKYQAVQWAFVEFIRKVATYETVFLIVADPKHQDLVASMLNRAHVNMDSVIYIQVKTNRSWMRDAGPVVVADGQRRAALQWQFNAWAKYHNYRLDRNVPGVVADYLNLPLIQVVHKGKPVVLEGGGIEVNGDGVLITTEECLLDPTIQVRNPGFTRDDYEQVFASYLGIEQVIWLGNGIVGDDTHGHVDDLARFVSRDRVVTVVEPNQSDDNYQPLQDNLKRLQSFRFKDGRSLEVVELPMPGRIMFEGVRLPASYANFLIINEAVLVPTFNDPEDRVALQILSDCFPDRTVVGMSAIDLIWGFGTYHCLSQQIPAQI